MRRTFAAAVAVWAVAAFAVPASAADWPTYQHDIARSGTTPEGLGPRLKAQWVFRAPHPPAPAWSDPQPIPIEGQMEYPRVRFDDAFHVAAAGDAVYFGSSSDNTVYCLSAATGGVRWRFHTGGPVRLAPTVFGGRVYVGSDDGRVYCLSARDGGLIWRFRAGPGDERVLGHGRMISLWPIRTGVLVDGGIAYFGAGLFPAEGLFLYAVSAETGKLIWRNDTTGRGGMAGLSPQGYLLASEDRLYVPSGRAGPALFDRKTGKLVLQKDLVWRRHGLFGGAYAVLAGDHLFSGTQHIVAYSRPKLKTGHAWIPGRRLVVTHNHFHVLTGRYLACYDRRTYPAASRKQNALIPKRSEKRRRQYELRGLRPKLAAARKPHEQAQKQVDALAGRIAELKKTDPKAESKQIADRQRQLEAAKKALAAAAGKVAAVQKQIDAVHKRLKPILDLEKLAAKMVREATKWQVRCTHVDSMVLAGSMLYVGGPGEVLAVDSVSGRQVERHKVEGKARGLAVANGRLLVSTDTGRIHCFAAGQAPVVAPEVEEEPTALDARRKLAQKNLRMYERAVALFQAKKVLEELRVRRGYALILGGDGALPEVLAGRTDLRIHVAQSDPSDVTDARKRLSKARLLGARVCVDSVPLHRLPYPSYFANLVVSLATVKSGKRPATPVEEVVRVLKPLGGVAYVVLPPDERAEWLAAAKNDPSVEVTPIDKTWVRLTRGALPGAGSWTHEYGEPGNTGCGDDQRVKGPLGVLWFGEPGPTRMPSRHGSAPSPLGLDGRMFVQLEDAVCAYDAYNGVKLWETPLKGAARERLYGTGTKYEMSNFVARTDSLFVAVGDKCHRLNVTDGKIGQTYTVPEAARPAPKPRKHKPDKPVAARWGYLAVVGDLLFGSGTTEQGRVSDCVFALDVPTGRRKWLYRGKDVMHTTIAVGGGRVYLVDRNVTAEQRREAVDARPKAPARAPKDRKGKPIPPDVRVAKALDMKTGKTQWQRPVDVSDCVKIGRAGGQLSSIYRNEVLLLCGQPWNGHFWREFLSGRFSRRSIIALSAGAGKRLWSGHKGYRSRPLVVGDTIYAEPWAHSLYTGEPVTRTHPITGRTEKWQMSRPGHHCGCLAAAPSYLFFRSGSTGYYDLRSDTGTAHFGAQRPGCWINVIPANGLVLIPEASSGCVCPFSIMTTVVLKPRKTDRAWNIFSAPGPMTPVRHLAVNLGAPGDRRGPDGKLWLGFPRPYKGRLAMDLKAEVKFLAGGEYYRRNREMTQVAGTATPWIYTYGANGPDTCTVSLFSRKDKGGALYTVRLHFAEPIHDAPGRRVFGIKLQDKLVADKLDVAAAAGGKNRALVREFKDVPVALDLKIELVPRVKEPPAGQMPILSGIEVVRTRLVPSMPKPPKPTTKPTQPKPGA